LTRVLTVDEVGIELEADLNLSRGGNAKDLSARAHSVGEVVAPRPEGSIAVSQVGTHRRRDLVARSERHTVIGKDDNVGLDVARVGEVEPEPFRLSRQDCLLAGVLG